jgi:hypothetical protein
VYSALYIPSSVALFSNKKKVVVENWQVLVNFSGGAIWW